MGITHIEDLASDIFITAIKSIFDFRVEEKTDGSNLCFGLDEDGRFFTSRENKGGKRYYNSWDYEYAFWSTGFRCTHEVLEKFVNILQVTIGTDSLIECEILFGSLPNTVPYDERYDRIVLLRAIKSKCSIDVVKDALVRKIESIRSDTLGHGDTMPIDAKTLHQDHKYLHLVHATKSVECTRRIHNWQVCLVPAIRDMVYLKANFNSIETILNNYKKWLGTIHHELGITYQEIENIPINKCPENIDPLYFRTNKLKIKGIREAIRVRSLEFRKDIKQELLKYLVWGKKSAFNSHNDSWIEGLVFKDRQSDFCFKLVDKEIFTELNKYTHLIRNELRESIWLPFVSESKKNPEDVFNICQRYLDKIIDFGQYYKDKRKDLRFKYRKNGVEIFISYFHKDIHEKTLEAIEDTRIRIKAIQDKINPKLKQGGHVFDGCQRITLYQLYSTLDWFYTVAMPNSSIYVFPRYVMVGATGKSATNGDIDLAINHKDSNQSRLIDKCTKSLGADNVYYCASLDIVHVKAPIQGNPALGYVQIDLMFSPNFQWTIFNYASGGDASAYKGSYRRMLLSAVTASTNITTYDGDQLIRREGWVWIPKLGIQWQVKERKLGKTGGYKKAFEKTHEGRVIDQPDEVIKLLFGAKESIPIGITQDWLNTLEGVLDSIQRFKTPEQQRKIFEIFRIIVTHSKLPYPKIIEDYEQQI